MEEWKSLKRDIEEALSREKKQSTMNSCHACGKTPTVETEVVGNLVEWRVFCVQEDCPCQPYTTSCISLAQAKVYWNERKEIYNKKR